MEDDKIPNDPSDPEADPQEVPQVFAVSKEANEIKFSRRDFLQVAAAAAAAAALSGCSPENQSPTNTPAPSATKTATATPTKTSTPTRTSTPTPLPRAIAKNSANVRFGPGVDTRIVGGVAAKEELIVLGRNEDGSWLRVQQEDGIDGWIKVTLVDLTPGPVSDLPIVTPIPTATPLPGKPGKTSPGQSGRDYSYTDESGTVYHYTLPCGAPIPPGAVCVCDCVTVPAGCSCDKYKAPCACDKYKAPGGHYWYPN